MADITELGRRIKAKYPGQYDDLGERDLGLRVQKRYPGAYDDFTDAPENLQRADASLSAATTIKPQSKPLATAFDAAVRLPGVTSAEKTTLEKAKDFATAPLINAGDLPLNQNVSMFGALGTQQANRTAPKSINEMARENLDSPGVGVAQGTANIVSGLTSPMNLALGAGISKLPALGRAVAGTGFTIEQAAQLPDQVRGVMDAETPADKARSATELLGSAVLGVMGARGTMRDIKQVPQVRSYGDRTARNVMDTAIDEGMALGADRRTRDAARVNVAMGADKAQRIGDRFGLPPSLPPQAVSGITEAPPRLPSVQEQLMPAQEGRRDFMRQVAELDAVTRPLPPAPRDLPPHPVKSAAESADIFKQDDVRLTNEGTIVPLRKPTFREAQEARRAERTLPVETLDVSPAPRLPDAPVRPSPQPDRPVAAVRGSDVPATTPQVAPVAPTAAAKPTGEKTTPDFRAKTAKALGYNAAEMTPTQQRVVDDVLSNDPKRVSRALAKRSKDGETGALLIGSKPLTPAEKLAEENIQAREAARKASKSPRVSAVDSMRDLKRSMVDSIAPIEDALRIASQENKGKVSLLPRAEFGIQADRVLRSRGLASQFVLDSGLAKVIRDLPSTKDVDYLDQYVIAKRKLETGRSTDATRDAEIVKEFEPRYKDAAKVVYQHGNKLLDYMVESGLYTPEFAKALREKYPEYIPLNRIVPEQRSSVNKSGGKGVASFRDPSVVQKFGKDVSKLETEHSIARVLERTEEAFRQGEKNKAARLLADYRHIPGMEGTIKELVSVRRYKQLQADGKADGYASKNATHNANNTFSYREGNKVREFETTPDIARAARGLDVRTMGTLEKVLSAPVRVFKTGTTGVEGTFTIANVLRDQVTRYINQPTDITQLTEQRTQLVKPDGTPRKMSKNYLKFTPELAKDFVAGLVAGFGHKGRYNEIMRETGGSSSFDIVRDKPMATIESLRNTKDLKSRTKSILRPNIVKGAKSFMEAIENGIARSDESTRAMAYNQAYREARDAGFGDIDAKALGAKAYNQMTANFSRSGELSAVAKATLPYFNAGLQGSRSTVQGFQRDPTGAFVRLGASVMLPVAAATLYNLSDPDRKKAYEDIEDYDKEHGLVVVLDPKKDGKGQYLAAKPPLPPGIGELGNYVRRAIEQQYGMDPIGAREALGIAIGSISPVSGSTPGQIIGNVTPQVLKGGLEVAVNQNLFTGKKIEPGWMQDREPQDRVYDNTSGTARAIAGGVNVLGGGMSPIQADHLLRSTFGSVTPQATYLADRAVIDAAKGAKALGLPVEPPLEQPGGTSFVERLGQRFAKARGGAIDRKELEATEKAEREYASTRAPEMTLARKLADRYRAGEDITADAEAAVADGRLTDRGIKFLEQSVQDAEAGVSRWESDLRKSPVAVRAKRLLEKIMAEPEDKRQAKYEEFIEKELITESVEEAMAKLMEGK